mmetsp:Transcript_37172/g.59916  ORF Transcript_37172/g.59916 Transcript_37172/m.59916 type:complete len:223 (-) Transcript_37172:159-827(-)
MLSMLARFLISSSCLMCLTLSSADFCVCSSACSNSPRSWLRNSSSARAFSESVSFRRLVLLLMSSVIWASCSILRRSTTSPFSPCIICIVSAKARVLCSNCSFKSISSLVISSMRFSNCCTRAFSFSLTRSLNSENSWYAFFFSASCCLPIARSISVLSIFAPSGPACARASLSSSFASSTTRPSSTSKASLRYCFSYSCSSFLFTSIPITRVSWAIFFDIL